MNPAQSLLNWYDSNARDLPWRRTKDPYHILVSEFMLQQTQVQTVIPFYHAFLERFPTVEHLAQSAVDDVLVLWKGLGYYRRAQNLHRSAQIIVSEHGGRLPKVYDEVRALPGVGDYTAAALLSIAYGQPYPVLDGNVARVTARLLNMDEPVDQSSGKRRMLTFLDELLPRSRPGDFNQAMMELGATVCLPRMPDCSACPLQPECLAQQQGRQEILPIKKSRTQIRVENRTVIIARRGEWVYLERRPEKGLLARMWEFPHETGRKQDVIQKVVGSIVPGADESLWELRHLGQVEHRFTHLVWRFDVVEATLPEPIQGLDSGVSKPRADADRAWLTPHELGQVALPTVMQKVWRLAAKPVQTKLPNVQDIE